MIELAPLSGAAIEAHGASIRGIYQRAFETTADHAERFITSALGRHQGYAGFAGLLAMDGERVVGFAYGYHSAPGGWWHDTVGPAIREAGHERWLEDAFEFVELAVDPLAHGRGVGGRLHHALLVTRPEATALLSTGRTESPARAMYRKRGWVPLVEPYRYPGSDEEAVIMGLRLVAVRERA